MNSLLAKHRPKDLDKEQWEKVWNNSHPQLQPLANVIKELMTTGNLVKPSDFETPNHYAKLVADLSRKAALQAVLDLLPDGVKKD